MTQHYSPGRALSALVAAHVEFIVIGGIAAVTHGSSQLTFDLDICYRRTRDNLERLAHALRAMHATPRGAPADLPFRLDARTLLNGDSFTFATDFGDIDCLGTPSGTRGYEDLLHSAIEVELQGMRVQIAGLDDLIRMKRSAGRPKDLYALEILGALRDELDGDPPPAADRVP